jgi:hypothetical protein
MTAYAHFVCRDNGNLRKASSLEGSLRDPDGYGVETGEVVLPAIGGPDWTGKRAYQTVDRKVVYLFDDEVQS